MKSAVRTQRHCIAARFTTATAGDQVRELITAETADLSSDDQAPLSAAGH